MSSIQSEISCTEFGSTLKRSDCASFECGFNAAVFVSEQLNRLMVNAAQELAARVVSECGSRYNFDSEEAIRLLGLNYIKLERKSTGKIVEQKSAKAKVLPLRSAFPLPFNGEFNDMYCYALRQNNGLYTQCQIARKGDKHYCKSCQALAEKSDNGVPEYGTIQSRLACGIFEYVDPKGRNPVAYTKVMKKYKVSEEQVQAEAGKLSIIVDVNHFVVPEDTKRGRPSSIKVVKEPKGVKGRPKKTKKVLQIDGDDDDLFASLVADANSTSDDEDEEIVIASKTDGLKKKGKSEEEKESERIAKESEKAEKLAKLATEKAEKEAKLAAEKQEKEAKKDGERLARELKKAEEEESKKALALQKEEQRLKEKAQAQQEKEAKSKEAKSKETKSKTKEAKTKPVVEEEVQVRVKKIEYEGNKYLKSKDTGIIYDFTEYTKNGEQVVIGKWNDSTSKIDFTNSSEEEEEEYEE
jgi:hypothetical protein